MSQICAETTVFPQTAQKNGLCLNLVEGLGRLDSKQDVREGLAKTSAFYATVVRLAR